MPLNPPSNSRLPRLVVWSGYGTPYSGFYNMTGSTPHLTSVENKKQNKPRNRREEYLPDKAKNNL